MAGDIKSLKMRIGSVDSMLHTTKAMGLVASSKIRRATDLMLKSEQFLQEYDSVIKMILSLPERPASRYFEDTGDNRTVLIVIAGDRSLAGGYNSNIWKFVEAFRQEGGHEITRIIAIGSKAKERYKAEGYNVEKLNYSDVTILAKNLAEEYLSGGYDKLCIISTKYKSVISQIPTMIEILPLKNQSDKVKPLECILEPAPEDIISSIVPGYIASSIYAKAKESFCCEVVARRNAMDNAGKNAEKMLDDLKLSYNRARQSAITREITEIVAGAEN